MVTIFKNKYPKPLKYIHTNVRDYFIVEHILPMVHVYSPSTILEVNSLLTSKPT